VSLTPAQISALRELEEVWPDLVGRSGWTRHADLEHRFESPQGAKLDVLPAGDQLLLQGTIAWGSGHVMSLVGIDLVFGHAESHQVEEGFIAKVAPPQVVTVLKMAAYLDRPQERLRDLEDIAHLLESYVDDRSPRFWDEAIEHGVYELAPAYLLGLDIGRIAAEPHLGLAEEFLSHVADTNGIAHALMQRRGPRRWSTEEQALLHRLNAFRAGVTAGTKHTRGLSR
jgi:predicted nucleotidyltransferase